MGEVYRARDTRLGRDVAIKILPQRLTEKSDAKQRFEREARAISALNHAHICTLYDAGHQDGTDFLMMEFLRILGRPVVHFFLAKSGRPRLLAYTNRCIDLEDNLA